MAWLYHLLHRSTLHTHPLSLVEQAGQVMLEVAIWELD